MSKPDVSPARRRFGELLTKYLRNNPVTPLRGYTDIAFAKVVGVKPPTIGYWRKGTSFPDADDKFDRIIHALFGEVSGYDVDKEKLRNAWSAARQVRPPRAGGASIAQQADKSSDGNATVANFRTRVPAHFVGHEILNKVHSALVRPGQQLAAVALHGMRGVGKTTLAIAYCHKYSAEYRAIWWIGARTELGMRADLVNLGVRLNWVRIDGTQELALSQVVDRLNHEGERILLIYDGALDANSLKPCLPSRGLARIIATSNNHAWRSIATPIEIKTWSKDVGADFLLARSGCSDRLEIAEGLSEALEGLPLAHEMAAAFCERRESSLADYNRRFNAAPVATLDDDRSVPVEYGLTVAKAFTVAIDEVAKSSATAEILILHAAQLAPEPIPLFLFHRAREKFDEPFASMLSADGLEQAVAELRAFALINREIIIDEQSATVTTDAVRLHRLVREVAATRRSNHENDHYRRALIAVLAEIFPRDSNENPALWPLSASLLPHVFTTCQTEMEHRPFDASPQVYSEVVTLLASAGRYLGLRASYTEAQMLYEIALLLCENVLFGPNHPETAMMLHNIAWLHQAQGDFTRAQLLFERSLAIREKTCGLDNQATAQSLESLSVLLHDQGEIATAKKYCTRALAIREKILDPDDREIATSLSNLSLLLQDEGDFVGARKLIERSIEINEKALGPDHPETVTSFNNLATLLYNEGALTEAQRLMEQMLKSSERHIGPEHPETAIIVDNLAVVLRDQGDLVGAIKLSRRALATREKMLGSEHPHTQDNFIQLAKLLHAHGDVAEAEAFLARALTLGREK